MIYSFERINIRLSSKVPPSKRYGKKGNWHLTDHSPITTWLNINKKTSYNHTILEGDTLTRSPKQFLWENDSAQKFKDALRSPRIRTLIRDYIAGETFSENAELSVKKVEKVENISQRLSVV